LTFQYDPSVAEGVRMSKLIDELVTDNDDAAG
jgi:ribosome-binding factor A